MAEFEMVAFKLLRSMSLIVIAAGSILGWAGTASADPNRDGDTDIRGGEPTVAIAVVGPPVVNSCEDPCQVDPESCVCE